MKFQTRSILLAAVVASPLLLGTSAALAQYQVPTGNVNDANNRIGSGGFNDSHSGAVNQNAINNLLITNDITGGRGFQGSVPYSAPGAFHGNTGMSGLERFTAGSSSAYSNNAQTVQPYFSQAQYGNQPPAGFVADPKSPGLYTAQQPQARDSSDMRLGVINNEPLNALPRPGELALPSQVDTSNISAPLDTSPMTGQPVMQDASPDDLSALQRFSNMRRTGYTNQLGDDKAVQSMRDELRKNIVSDNPADNNGNDSTDANDPTKPKTAAQQADLSSSAKIDKPFESPTSTNLPNQPLGSTLTGATIDNTIHSDQSTTNQLVPAPAEQSTQYAELSKRFAKLQQGPQTDQQANSTFNQQLQARTAAIKAKQDDASKMNPAAAGGPGMGVLAPSGTPAPSDAGVPTPPVAGPVDTGTAPALPPEAATPAKPADQAAAVVPPTPARANAAADQGPQIDTTNGMIRPGSPVVIKSLTDGMKPGRLRDLLGTAEDQMKHGQYTSALDQYDLAERVVPNNPLISLGRANAELGASYYARADNDIRKAFAADGALMLGQFSLQQFIGTDRVTFLVSDLKDITKTEPKSVRAPFLLAYLMYNTGDKKMAANYLALSDSRAAQPDPLYKQMRVYWDLPAADPLPTGDAK